jgi:hypothetical protein
MKKVGLFVGLGIIVVIIIAAMMAGKMGETSYAFAKGKIILDESLIDQAAKASTLYVIISGTDRPMPFGAFRKSITKAPGKEVYDFVLTKDNIQAMQDISTWPNEIKLKARLDLDGAAGPDQPGDLVGELYPVTLGSKDLVLKIDRLVD